MSPTEGAHPRLAALVARARAKSQSQSQSQSSQQLPRVALVHPGDALALQAAAAMLQQGIARPLLVGGRELIQRAADSAAIDLRDFEIVDAPDGGPGAARRATALARDGAVMALMKGSLHTDELMAAVVNKQDGLRTDTRISHAFVFDLPRYDKLLALADCVVNIAPDLRTKRDILGNALADTRTLALSLGSLQFLQRLGVAQPHVGVVAAVEAVNPSIPATMDAQALVEHARDGHWPGAVVEGPFGFDNAFSAEAARIKGMDSRVAGHADLLLMPDLNAGNMLYKSFVYVGRVGRVDGGKLRCGWRA